MRCARSSSGTRQAKQRIAWPTTSRGSQDKNSPVDTINGFIEVYMDPRGHKGSWEALVFYVEPREDRRDPQARCRRAMVRGSDAVGPSVSETGGAGHHRQRHRRRHRNRRLRTDHAGRNQPAERSGHPREIRQQVGLAVERQRGLRPVDVRGVPSRVRVDAGGGGAGGEVEQHRPGN